MACVLEAISLVWVVIGGGLPLQPGCATGLRDSRLALDDPDADWIGLFVDVAGGSECVVGNTYEAGGHEFGRPPPYE